MSNDSVVKLIQPGTFNDLLTDVLRNVACTLLAQAVEAEVAEFLGKHADLKTEAGLLRVVRHGHLPERQIMTGIGPVAVRHRGWNSAAFTGRERPLKMTTKQFGVGKS